MRWPRLLGAGADVNAENDAGRTPLYWARAFGKREVEALLRQHGAECPYAFDDSD
jgi:ankyrin repeat protein